MTTYETATFCRNCSYQVTPLPPECVCRLQAVEWLWRDARNIGYEVSVELYAPDANRYGKHAAEAK